MTQTSAPKSPSWLEALKLFAPTINQVLQAIVLVLVGAASTLGVQWYRATPASDPQPAPKIDVVKTVPENGSLLSRLKALEDEFEAMKKKEAERPKVIRPARKQQG